MESLITTLTAVALCCGIVAAQSPVPSSSPKPQSSRTEQGKAEVTAQDEFAEGEVLRISANLISVPVTVIDRQGQYVVDLLQSDFRIFEDGEEQTISHFSNVDRPFSVALLLDTSGSTAPFLDQIKRAAKAFVEQLRPSDTVRPMFFHGEIRALTKAVTSDRKVLSTAIDQMEPGPLLQGTRLYDAVATTLGLLKPEPARKAIILFTDGQNTWGKATKKGTLEDAQESGVIIYALQYGDDPPSKYLQELAEATGGRYFRASDANLIRQSFAGVAQELRRQYLIGYYPKTSPQNGEERLIKVRVNRERVAVRARKSYVFGP